MTLRSLVPAAVKDVLRPYIGRPIRRSPRPEKQLFWLWLQPILKESARYEAGLDVACGWMKMRRHIKTRTYRGIDFNPERIAKGLSKNPGAVGVVRRIEDMDDEDVGDYVFCVQTIAINRFFGKTDIETAFLAIDKIIRATKPGGMLVFNVGEGMRPAIPEVVQRLKAEFDEVECRHYGRGQNPRPLAWSLLLARAMFVVPRLAHTAKTGRWLFVCRGKRSSQ
jgi:hypothetical protein